LAWPTIDAAARAVKSAGTGCRQALHKLHFTNGAHLLRSVGAVHGPGLDKHGGANIVPAVNVIGQLVQKVPLVGDALRAEVPEVMMGVADRNLRFQGRFLSQSQPIVTSEGHFVASIL
jgi:hypothetical protein